MKEHISFCHSIQKGIINNSNIIWKCRWWKIYGYDY